MKPGRKRAVRSDSDMIGTEDTIPDTGTEAVEDTATINPVSVSAPGGRFAIDGVRGLRAITAGVAVVALVWLVPTAI